MAAAGQAANSVAARHAVAQKHITVAELHEPSSRRNDSRIMLTRGRGVSLRRWGGKQRKACILGRTRHFLLRTGCNNAQKNPCEECQAFAWAYGIWRMPRI